MYPQFIKLWKKVVFCSMYNHKVLNNLSESIYAGNSTAVKNLPTWLLKSNFSRNNTDLIAKISDAASESGERVWELPMFEEYGEQIKSDVSDVKNVGGRPAGSITAAKFLEKFVGETPWVHLDIAGVDMATKNNGWVTKGASGQAVRTLINLVCNWKN